MSLRTRQPTGAAAWPLVLIEGTEASDQRRHAALLSASDRIGHMYWLDLGHGMADEYAALPGASYDVVVHDGSFGSVLEAITEIRDIARDELRAGGAPVALVIDSMTTLWQWIKDWAAERVRQSAASRAKLARDPHADVPMGNTAWNLAHQRHREIMRVLLTFPGIVAVTARARWSVPLDHTGQQAPDAPREYRVDAHKTLTDEATCWIRVARDEPAVLVGAHSAHLHVATGAPEPHVLPDGWTIEDVVFGALRLDPASAHVRDLVDARPEPEPADLAAQAVQTGTTFERLEDLLGQARALGYGAVLVPNERGRDEPLARLLTRLCQQQQFDVMKRLWDGSPEFAADASRLAFVRDVIGRSVSRHGDMTIAESSRVIGMLRAHLQKAAPNNHDVAPDATPADGPDTGAAPDHTYDTGEDEDALDERYLDDPLAAAPDGAATGSAPELEGVPA